MRRFVLILCSICFVLLLVAPSVWAQTGEELPSPSFIPPIEADFYGGTQYNVTGPLGITVRSLDRSLRVGRTDLMIPGCELPLRASFSYSSNRHLVDSPYGRGWRFEYGATYTRLADGSLIIGPIRGGTQRYWPGSSGLTQSGPDRYQLRLSDGTTYYFDAPGHKGVTKIESQNGNYLLMKYNNAGELTRITDHYGRYLDFSYSAGQLIKITDANASPVRTVEYSYDSTGSLANVTDSQGESINYTYTVGTPSSPSALKKISSPGGNWALISYDTPENAAVIQVSSPLGTLGFESKPWGQCPTNYPMCTKGTMTTVTDIVGGEVRKTRYHYNTQRKLALVIDAKGGSTSYGYDADGQLINVVDPNLVQTLYEYDSAGMLIQVTNPLSRTTSFTYDPETGLVSSVTDPMGRTSRYEYDAKGNLVAYTDPLSNTTQFTYDCCRPIAVTNPLSQTTHYSYDTYGYPTTVQDGAGVNITLEYNARGNLIQETDGLGNNYHYDYNLSDHISAVTNPDSSTHQFFYGSAGELSKYVSPAGRPIYYSYDLKGRPLRVTDALGQVNYNWDTSDNITAVTNGEGNQDTLVYDFEGRIISRTDGLARATNFQYDGNGNLIQRADPLGHTTVYTYNAADELIGVEYPDGITITFQYDGIGNLTREANADVVVEYEYDAVNRLTGVIMDGETIAYTYDAAGRRASMTDPDGYLTTYGYDGGGRLITVTHQLAGTTSFHYDSAGRLNWMEHPSGVISSYTFDALGQLESIIHKDSSDTVLDSYTYSYDKDGKRTSVTEPRGTTSYAYDQRNQLTGVTYPDSTSSSFTYDLAGNRLSKDGTTSNYDTADQLTSAGSTSYGWDVRGNLLSETAAPYQTDYQYDHENRLTQANYYDGTDVLYRYYPDGRLWSRTDRAGQITHYYYDGPNLLLETDGSGNPLARYVNGLAVDSWLAMVQDGQSYSYFRDGLNNITSLADEDESLAATYQYDPWGGILAETGGLYNPLRFTGRYWDDDAELYRYRARLYDPDTGRFLSRDPLGPVLVHKPYAYSDNNPTSYIDPLGLDTWTCKSVKAGAGFLVGIEVSTMMCSNRRTGEACTLTTYCFKLGALAGAGGGMCGGINFDGPAKGSDFAGGSFSGFAEAAVGVGVGVGADVAVDTESGSIGGNVCGGAGAIGAEIGIGGQYCHTSVSNCSKDEEEDREKDEPPDEPGKDHADDNYSAASPIVPLPALSLAADPPVEYRSKSRLTEDSELSPLRLVEESQVGILWNGYAEEAWAYLSSLGWAATPVLVNFDPASLDLPVLFIPSGGLYGLDGAPSFQARLEAYTASGGVIVALSQQRGHEFGALPGGELEGYGWTEDNSCFSASLYVSEYHPLLAGFRKSELTSGVDGFFTQLPDNAQVLLHRSKNGQPGFILYTYGNGWVVAGTLYDDWGASNWQAASDSARLLGDTLSWALNPNSEIPQFDPGAPVTVPLTIANATDAAAAFIEVSVIKPDGTVYSQQTLTQTVPSYGQMEQSIEVLDLGEEAELGIWWVRYTLFGDRGGLVQPAAWGAPFAISDPHLAAGPNRTLGLSITAPAERFVPGPATFTFHIYNFSDTSRQATVFYGFPHHTWETGISSYGNFDRLTREVTVAPHGVVTFTHTTEILTNDRLFARLVQTNETEKAWFQINIQPATPVVQVGTDQDAYIPNQTVQAAVTVTNRIAAVYTPTIHLTVRDALGEPLFIEQFSATLPSLGVIHESITFSLPVEAQVGTASIIAEVTRDGPSVAVGRNRFQILANPLTFATALPDTLIPGANQILVVTATNTSFTSAVVSATLEATLTNPTEAIQFLGVQTFTLPTRQSLRLNFPFITPAAQLGVYTFTLTARDEYGERIWHLLAPNQPILSIDFDQPSYVAREELVAKVVSHNPGLWAGTYNLRVEVTAANYVLTDTVTLASSGQVTATHIVSLPDTLTAGTYTLTATLEPMTESAIMKTATWVVPDASLHVLMGDRSLTAGSPATLTVINDGGIDTAASYMVNLQDAFGVSVASISGTLPVVPADAADWITLTVPAGAVSGDYTVRGVVTCTQSSQVQRFRLLATVEGTSANLRAETDHFVYGVGQPISATTWITNTNVYPVDNAVQELAVEAGSGWTWFNHMPGQQGPASSIKAMVTDSAGIKWLATHLSVNAFDDGGTPLDQSDDRWQVFQGRQTYIHTVYADAAGTKWIGSYLSSAGALSALDDGGTPFDKTDDRWLHYDMFDDIPGFGYSIDQDAAGILWIGHLFYGASAFDPGPDPLDMGDDQWYQFTAANSDLVADGVKQVAVDSDGNVWFVTSSGISVLDYGADPFDPVDDIWYTHVPYGSAIKVMGFDNAGNKWFGSFYDGATVFDSGPSPFDYSDDNWYTFDTYYSDICDDTVYAIAVDSAGNKWFGGDSCVSLLDTGADPFDDTDDTWHVYANDYLQDDVVVISLDSGSLVWFGPSTVLDEEGMSLLDHGGTPFEESDDSWTAFSSNQGIGSNRVASIAADTGGFTWFAIDDGGLRVLDQMGTPTDSTDDQWAIFYSTDGLPFNNVRAVTVDQSGIVWAGSSSGGIGVLNHGGSPFNKSDDVWATVETTVTGINRPNYMVVDDANLKWIAGEGPSSVPALAVLDDGNTPITTTDDVVTTFEAADGLTSIPRALAIDETGVKWIAASTYALALADGGTPFDKSDDLWVSFTTSDGLLYGGSVHGVYSVDVDEENQLWFSVYGETGGVSVLDYNGTLADKSDDTWRSFQTADGLVDSYVRGVVVDAVGNKWIGTVHGISRLDDGGDPFDGLNDTWETYTKTHGLVYDWVWGMFIGEDGGPWAFYEPMGASVAIQQTSELWSAEQAVDHLSAEGITQTLTIIPGLQKTGRYQLSARFLNDLGQTLALDRVPFYVDAGEAALTLDAEPDPVRSGETLTVTAALVNLGASALTNQTITLTQDGQIIVMVGPFDVPVGGSHVFDVVTSAPVSGDSTALSASSSSGLQRDLSVTIARPIIAAAVEAPAFVGVDPFTLTVSLTNTGDIVGSVGVSFKDTSAMVEVLPGGTALVQHEAQLCADADLDVMLTGDLTETLVVPVGFGPSVDAVFYPPPVTPIGIIEIPYLLTNTGSLAVEATMLITLTGSQQKSFDSYLPASGSAGGNRVIDVASGAQILDFALYGGVCTLNVGQAEFLVAPDITAAVTVTVGTPGAQVPVTASLSNTGMAPYSGTLRLETDDGYWVDQTASMAVGASGLYTFSLDSTSILTGTRLVTVTAVTNEGQVVAQDAGSFTLLGPDLQLSSLPTTTVLPAGETVTLTFGVTNHGDQDGTVELGFTLGDLADEAVVRVVAAAETIYPQFVFYVPPEIETKEYLAVYNFNGEQGELLLTIQGISLTVAAGGDQPAYREESPVILALTVTNQLATTVPELFALVNMGDITATIPFTLTASPEVLTFPITATFGGGGVVFYGIYHEPSERGIYLNTYRLAQLQPVVTVLLDQEVYLPGDMVQAAVVTTATGELGISAPGYTTTLSLAGGNTSFGFVLPAPMDRGTYAVDYRLTGCDCEHEGRQYQAWFDVAAPEVRVIESRLDRQNVFPGDTLNLRLTVASDTPLDVVLRSYVVYPDGSQGAVPEQALFLLDRLDNITTVPALITSTQAGMAFFHYELVDAADATVVRSAGVEAFDLGIVSVVGVTTDQTEYLAPTLPVTAVVQLYASQAISGDLFLTLDGASPQITSLELSTGYQMVPIRLDDPITPGRRVLTAAFSVGGLSSQVDAVFDYGISLSDLVSGIPSLVPITGNASVPTRTLSLIVYNQGASSSPSTQVSVYDEEVGGGGALIGSGSVPALDPGQLTTVWIDWDVVGKGGDHLLRVEVDPVDEFDMANNIIFGEVMLPRLASVLAANPPSIPAGGNLAVQVTVENMQAIESLPLTMTLRIDPPIGVSVYTESWTLTLDGGEQLTVDTEWDSSPTSVEGLYVVELEIIDVYGDRHEHRSFFAVDGQMEAVFTADPTSGIAPLSVDFTNLSTGDFDTCQWVFGDGGASTDCEDNSYIYMNPGIYTVSLTISGSSTTDTITRTNYITTYQAVSSNFTASPTSGPDPLHVVFSNESAGDFDTCLWYFGDGNDSHLCSDVSHDYLLPGTYTISLTVSGLGGSETITQTNYITVYQHVEAGFIADPTSGPVPLTVAFSNLSTGDFDTCSWDFGDGETSDICDNPIHIYADLGEYNVTLTIAGLGGTDSKTLTEYISVGSAKVFLPILFSS